MPPKPKFTREEITETALELVSAKGIEALTAQELGHALGSSARPIFTVFKGMGEVKESVQMAAMERFETLAAEECSTMPLFKQIGMKMVLFGIREPKLYQLLFMQENAERIGFDGMLQTLGTSVALCVQTIEKDYGLTEVKAKSLFERMWIFTFGIGTLCAAKTCSFTEEEVSELLTAEFRALMQLERTEQ